jgi:hypothetical protein
MNTIKWNLNRTGFVLTFENGTKETYCEKPSTNTTYVKVNGIRYWLCKVN